MIKLLILLNLVFFINNICFAADYYVFIDKIGVVEQGKEAGQTEKGDVVAVAPFTDQYKPTPAERTRYQIVVVDLTDEERASLIQSEMSQENREVQIRARIRKVDYENFSDKNQEIRIDKNEFNSRIIIK